MLSGYEPLLGLNGRHWSFERLSQDNDMFQVNSAFECKLVRIKVPLLLLRKFRRYGHLQSPFWHRTCRGSGVRSDSGGAADSGTGGETSF
jgi:hypothetical protein